MKIIDFLSDDFFGLPRTQGPKEDYKTFVNRIFKEFLEKLKDVWVFRSHSATLFGQTVPL